MITITQPELAAKQYIERLILPSDPMRPLWNRESIIFHKPAKWNYIDGCMIKASAMLYELTNDERLLEYAVHFIDSYVDENGTISAMDCADFNLDNINGAKNLLYLYGKTSDERYYIAAEKLYSCQLSRQPRLNCGNFWHKAIYPSQVWLDGAYMVFPFMAEYAVLSGKKELFDDIHMQLRNIRSIMRDDETGLYYHGYDETRSMKWADPETGLSQEFWLRAMGWLCAALVDTAEAAADSEGLCSLCNNMSGELLEALSGYISPEGILLQLPARPELERNYPETSGTLLFAYSAMKAYRLGIVDESLRDIGIKAFLSVTDNYIRYVQDEAPVLKNICLMAGLGGKPMRDGSAEYYLSERIVENDAKGIAPYLMAYTEYMKL